MRVGSCGPLTPRRSHEAGPISADAGRHSFFCRPAQLLPASPSGLSRLAQDSLNRSMPRGRACTWCRPTRRRARRSRLMMKRPLRLAYCSRALRMRGILKERPGGAERKPDKVCIPDIIKRLTCLASSLTEKTGFINRLFTWPSMLSPGSHEVRLRGPAGSAAAQARRAGHKVLTAGVPGSVDPRHSRGRVNTFSCVVG